MQQIREREGKKYEVRKKTNKSVLEHRKRSTKEAATIRSVTSSSDVRTPPPDNKREGGREKREHHVPGIRY